MVGTWRLANRIPEAGRSARGFAPETEDGHAWSRVYLSGRRDINWQSAWPGAIDRIAGQACRWRRAAPLLSRHGRHACHWTLDDRQVDETGEHAEQNREPPDKLVGAGPLKHDAAEPNPEETPDLVAKERKAEQHGEPTGPKLQCDQWEGRRHRGQPQQSKLAPKINVAVALGGTLIKTRTASA